MDLELAAFSLTVSFPHHWQLQLKTHFNRTFHSHAWQKTSSNLNFNVISTQGDTFSKLNCSVTINVTTQILLNSVTLSQCFSNIAKYQPAANENISWNPSACRHSFSGTAAATRLVHLAAVTHPPCHLLLLRGFKGSFQTSIIHDGEVLSEAPKLWKWKNFWSKLILKMDFLSISRGCGSAASAGCDIRAKADVSGAIISWAHSQTIQEDASSPPSACVLVFGCWPLTRGDIGYALRPPSARSGSLFCGFSSPQNKQSNKCKLSITLCWFFILGPGHSSAVR